MTDPVFADLQPRPVWEHFATLCAIPRHSKQEATLRAHLLVWARQNRLVSEVDAAGNLLLRKPASPGCEERPGVVLQGHLDMVCQQNAGFEHDFLRDPIRPVLKDGWLLAEQTTLGADNGIGVPEASRKDLFAKFKRGSNVSGVQGTGLGLSIVKGIVEAHGGKIWFESEVDKGTTFFFTLSGKEMKA